MHWASDSVGGRFVPFRYVQHLLTVPVVFNGSRPARFVLDPGIALTLVSEELAAELGCSPTGSTSQGGACRDRT